MFSSSSSSSGVSSNSSLNPQHPASASLSQKPIDCEFIEQQESDRRCREFMLYQQHPERKISLLTDPRTPKWMQGALDNPRELKKRLYRNSPQSFEEWFYLGQSSSAHSPNKSTSEKPHSGTKRKLDLLGGENLSNETPEDRTLKLAELELPPAWQEMFNTIFKREPEWLSTSSLILATKTRAEQSAILQLLGALLTNYQETSTTPTTTSNFLSVLKELATLSSSEFALWQELLKKIALAHLPPHTLLLNDYLFLLTLEHVTTLTDHLFLLNQLQRCLAAKLFYLTACGSWPALSEEKSLLGSLLADLAIMLKNPREPQPTQAVENFITLLLSLQSNFFTFQSLNPQHLQENTHEATLHGLVSLVQFLLLIENPDERQELVTGVKQILGTRKIHLVQLLHLLKDFQQIPRSERTSLLSCLEIFSTRLQLPPSLYPEVLLILREITDREAREALSQQLAATLPVFQDFQETPSFFNEEARRLQQLNLLTKLSIAASKL